MNNNFTIKEVFITKLKKPFCQSCGLWAKSDAAVEGESVKSLFEIWLSEGAVPVIRICENCCAELEITLKTKNDQPNSTNPN